LDAARYVAASVGNAAGRKPPSGERRLARLALAGGAKLAFPGLRLSASGGACSLLRLQRHLLAGGGLLGFCGRLPVVARRGGGGHYLRAEPKTFPSFRGA